MKKLFVLFIISLLLIGCKKKMLSLQTPGNQLKQLRPRQRPRKLPLLRFLRNIHLPTRLMRKEELLPYMAHLLSTALLILYGIKQV